MKLSPNVTTLTCLIDWNWVIITWIVEIYVWSNIDQMFVSEQYNNGINGNMYYNSSVINFLIWLFDYH